MVRARLVDMGVTKVPRGPQESTRSNPAGLTLRQAEVLQLLAQDLTYQEIAQRLYLSVKTVDHHAAAVRAKLDATDRDEAIAAARRLGLLDADNA
jgi:DNA-binding CsgD family transcriptional regulator